MAQNHAVHVVTLICKAFVVDAPARSITFTVKENRPTFAGVPPITPVDALILRPRGSVPLLILNANGVEPSATTTVLR